MNLKKSFLPKKLWLRGGIIGVIVCILLFPFYMFIYFPFVDKIFMQDTVIGELVIHSTPAWIMNVPLVTGHFFPFLSSFIVPYGFLCKFTEPRCDWFISKSIFELEAVPSGAVPWTMEGITGYCIRPSMSPTNSCANLSEVVIFGGFAALLLGIYFVIGAVIGGFIQKRKAK